MVGWLKRHWFDLGGVLGIGLGAGLIAQRQHSNTLGWWLWLSLLSLMAHQLEEYRWPGWFTGMLNRGVFHSEQPQRYPLNPSSALVVNVVVGWGSYLLAALLGWQLPALVIGTVLVSLGNLLAHSLLFPLRCRLLYNPGLATSWLLFAPISLAILERLSKSGRLDARDWVLGLVLGALLNGVGILGVIHWLRNPDAEPFPRRMLGPS